MCRTTARRQRSRSLAGSLSRSADWTEELERRLRSREEERTLDSGGSGEYLMGYKGGSQPICATTRSSCGQISTCGFQSIFSGQEKKNTIMNILFVWKRQQIPFFRWGVLIVPWAAISQERKSRKFHKFHAKHASSSRAVSSWGSYFERLQSIVSFPDSQSFCLWPSHFPANCSQSFSFSTSLLSWLCVGKDYSEH